LSIKELISSYTMCLKSRKEVIAISLWPAFIALLLASRGVPPPIEALKLILGTTFMGYGVYFYNDLRDLEDDLINQELGNPNPASRPLGSGKISKSRMWKFTVLSAILGILITFTINIQVLFLQLAYLALGILYSTEPFRLKKRFLMKQFTIAAGCALAQLSGGLTLGIINIPILYLMAITACLAIGVNPLLDLRDMRGDEVIGVKSIPLVWGPEITVRLALSMLAAIGVASIIGYLRVGFNITFPILTSIIIITWMYVVFPLLRKWNNPIFVNKVVLKRVVPLVLIIQFIIFLGVLPLSLF